MSVPSSCWSAGFAFFPAWRVPAAGMKADDPIDLSALAAERARIDAEIMARVARGDREAFAELYDRFSRPLYATALRILHQPAEAEDVVQDAFLALWENARSFEKTRGTAFAWAVTLTRNRAIDRARQKSRRAELVAQTTEEDAGTQPTGSGPDSAATLQAKEHASAIRAAVASLPAEQKRALELAFFDGLTQQEVSASLRQPLGTVKARIRRGLMRLREIMGGRHD